MNDKTRTFLLEPLRANYRQLFNDDWPNRLEEITKKAPRLHSLGFDLYMQWKGAACTAEFPAMLIDHLESFATGFIGEHTPNADLLRIAKSITARVTAKIPEFSNEPTLGGRLLAALLDTGADLGHLDAKPSYQFPKEEIWKSYFEERIFGLTLWSTLRICYCAIYNAYDNFVVRCLQVATGEPTLQTSKGGFSGKFSAAVGEAVLQQCWHSPDMKIIRAVRNALTHAGGRETRELRDLTHPLRVLNGELQIWPHDLRHEYATLKANVLCMAEQLRERPEFQTVPPSEK